MAFKIPPSFPSLIVLLVVVAAAFRPSAGVEYLVVNNAVGTPGGDRFNSDFSLGVEFTVSTLAKASDFVHEIFATPNNDIRDDVESITLFIDAKVEGAAFTIGNEIHVNAETIKDLPELPSIDFTRLLYHLVAHVWQWKGKGEPLWLIVGMADYIVLKSGYGKKDWVLMAKGKRWDQGSDVTARFLEYCNRLDESFVAKLNAAMKNEYNVGIFEELLDKSVEQLFQDYQAVKVF